MVDYAEFRILLVEDSPTSALLANRWLEDGLRTPFVLHTAAELSSALAVLQQFPVDLAILDLNLSDSTGLDTFRTVFAHAGDVPIVVLSGDSDEELAVEAVRLGAQDYVVKNNGVRNPLARPVRFAWERVQRRRAEIAWKAHEQQVLVARSVQQYLLPDARPRLDGFDIACRCEPAELIGGDYYDFIQLPCGALGMAIADVSGHGMAAAMMMIEVRAIIRTLARQQLSPSQVLEAANELVTPDLDQRFITGFFGVLQPQNRTFRYASAGHPVMVIRADGQVLHLDSSGMPLGIHLGPIESPAVISLNDGDLLVLYTDGLVERLSPHDGVFGTRRFAEYFSRHRHQPAADIVEGVFQAVGSFSCGIVQSDDETLVVIRVCETTPL